MPPKVLLKAAFRLETGKEYELDPLLDRLTASGYTRCGMVEGPGQFAVRGGILDIYSPAADMPIRAEFFGDELDTMGYFDPDTQRRTENVDAVTILGKNKLDIYYADAVYQIQSDKRFNALKYVHIFNRYKNISRGEENVKFLGL